MERGKRVEGRREGGWCTDEEGWRDGRGWRGGRGWMEEGRERVVDGESNEDGEREEVEGE